MKIYEINEKPGGYAMQSVGVQRINKSHIKPTIEYLSQLTGIPVKELHPLGSTGKTKTNGDIDIGIEKNRYDYDDIHKKLCNKLGKERCSFNKGTQVASYAIPIMRKTKNKELVEVGGNVQVDLMFVNNIKWANFAYHSEGTSGKPTVYKGAIRAVLLKAVAASLHQEGVDRFVYDPANSDLVIRIGRTFDLNKGLRRIFQFRPERKDQTSYVSGMKTVTSIKDLEPVLNKLKKKYPEDLDSVSLDIDDQEIIIDDPDDFLKILFPGRPKVKEEDVRTAEDIIYLIKSRFEPEQIKEIVRNATNLSKYLKTKMRVPEWDKELL